MPPERIGSGDRIALGSQTSGNADTRKGFLSEQNRFGHSQTRPCCLHSAKVWFPNQRIERVQVLWRDQMTPGAERCQVGMQLRISATQPSDLILMRDQNQGTRRLQKVYPNPYHSGRSPTRARWSEKLAPLSTSIEAAAGKQIVKFALVRFRVQNLAVHVAYHGVTSVSE